MRLDLGFSSGAERDLKEIGSWIEDKADRDVALAYVARIVRTYRKLTTFPDRGTPHDDLQRGLRSVPFERSATIFYRRDAGMLRIVRVLRAGRKWSRRFGRRP